MPPPERASCPHTGYLWPKNGVDNYGADTYGSPREVRLRWQYKKSDTGNPQNNRIAKDGTLVLVELTAIFQEIPVGSVIWFGDEDTWLGTGSNDTDATLFRIVGYNYVPDIKGREVARTVDVKEYRGTVPTVT